MNVITAFAEAGANWLLQGLIDVLKSAFPPPTFPPQGLGPPSRSLWQRTSEWLGRLAERLAEWLVKLSVRLGLTKDALFFHAQRGEFAAIHDLLDDLRWIWRT